MATQEFKASIYIEKELPAVSNVNNTDNSPTRK